MIRGQTGTTTVEFAIISVAVILVLLGVIEMCRLFFVTNVLGEATRRGARVAAVCPVNDPQIAETAIFSGAGQTESPIVAGLTTANILVEYLDQNGTAIAGDPSLPANFMNIDYVRVSVQNFDHELILPLPIAPLAMPARPTTLPRESLGVPRAEAIQACT